MANIYNACLNATTKHTLERVELWLTLSSCVLSIIGAVIIFSTFFLLPEIRNFTRKLIVWLTVADCITAVGYFIVVPHVDQNGATYTGYSTTLCQVQSFMTTYSSMVSFFLTMSVAVHILAKTVFRTPAENLVVYNLVSWGIPVVIMLVAAFENVLGNSDVAGRWCWIRAEVNHQVLWMFITGKAWELTTYVMTFLTFVLLKLYLYRQMHIAPLDDVLRQEDRNFMYVWLVLYIMRLPGTLKFLLSSLQVCNEHLPKFYEVLSIMQSVGDPAQAFGNSVLFCLMDRTVRDRLVDRFCRCRRVYSRMSSEEVYQSREEDSLLGRSSLSYGGMSPPLDHSSRIRSAISESVASPVSSTNRPPTPYF